MHTRRSTVGLATRLPHFTPEYTLVPWCHGHLGRVAIPAGKMPAPPRGRMQLITSLMLTGCLILKGSRTKLLQRPVHDYDVVLINENPAIRMNGNKFSAVLRRQISDETIIEFFTTW